MLLFFLVSVQCNAKISESMADSYAAYVMGLMDISRGNYLAAQKWLQTAHELDQNSVEILTELSKNAVQLGKIREAQHWTELALELEPDNKDLLLLMARIYIQQDKIKDAIDAIEQILKKEPDSQQALLMAGTLYAESKQWNKAEKSLKKAASLGGAKAFTAYYFLGKVAKERGDLTAAEQYLRQSVRQNSFFTPAIFELAEVYERQGKTDDAIKTYHSLLLRQQNNLKARQKLLFLLLEKGDKNEAMRQIKILKQLSKKDTNVQFRIALVLLQLGMPKDALEILEPLRSKLPGNPDLAFYTAIAYEYTDKTSKALRLYGQIPLDSEPGVDAIVHRARILMKKGRNIKAETILKNALGKKPGDVHLITALSAIYQELGKKKDAVKVLKKGLDKHPENKGLIMNMVMALDAMNKKEEAIKYARKALKLDPDYVPALNYIGYTYAELDKDLDEAERLVKKAVELSPNDGYILDSLGWVYFKKGCLEKAVTYLNKANTLVPDDPIIAEHLADAYSARQMFEEAVAKYREALKNAKKGEDKRRIRKKLERASDALSDMPDI